MSQDDQKPGSPRLRMALSVLAHRTDISWGQALRANHYVSELCETELQILLEDPLARRNYLRMKRMFLNRYLAYAAATAILAITLTMLLLDR